MHKWGKGQPLHSLIRRGVGCALRFLIRQGVLCAARAHSSGSRVRCTCTYVRTHYEGVYAGLPHGIVCAALPHALLMLS